jgi:hypothetical protein
MAKKFYDKDDKAKGSGFANMPTAVVQKEYPNPYGDINSPDLNDTISGIDTQISGDYSSAKKNRTNKKF